MDSVNENPEEQKEGFVSNHHHNITSTGTGTGTGTGQQESPIAKWIGVLSSCLLRILSANTQRL